jgi:8-oxo-dGTP pyrophosphatase MutT (NUDIX family)
MSKNNNLCNNCGKHGHLFHQCKLPITSYGIILFRKSEKGIQYLMIRRKDSFGYIDFIRGKYSPYNFEQVQNCINEMSNQEKERILNQPFDELWKLMWGENSANQYRNEEIVSLKKYEIIFNGIVENDKAINLQSLIKNSNSSWDETEWEFPKGRRNFHEKDLDCALREFEEETGYKKGDIEIFNNIVPFEEIFTGSNYKSYKHKYFVGIIDNAIIPINNFQIYEISEIKWVPITDVVNYIRDYNYEKTNIINDLNKLLKTYRLYI